MTTAETPKRNQAAMTLKEGQNLLGQGLIPEALGRFQQAIGIDPNYSDAYTLTGYAYASLGRRDVALRNYDRAVILDPRSIGALFGRGGILLDLGRYDESHRDFNQMIELNDGLVDGYLGRGYSRYGLDQYQDALTDFNRAFSMQPELPVAAHVGKGMALVRLGRYEEAEESLDRAKSIEPDNLDVNLCKGYAAQGLRQEEKAAASFEEALNYAEQKLQLNPEYSAAHNTRALALLELGRYEEALEAFERTREIEPTYPGLIKNKEKTQKTIADLSIAANPTSIHVPLTEERVREIVYETIALHPIIIDLRMQGVRKDDIKALVEAVLDTRQVDKQPEHSKQLSVNDEAKIQELERAAGDDADAQTAMKQFIREKIKTATEPQRVLSATLAIVGGFIPGAGPVIGIIQAINTLFKK
jgi:tetratricopeptide (TPR) repeat protein